MDARQQDRRKAPRRAEDAALHYARENLIASALALRDHQSASVTWGVLWMRFLDAAEVYRAAELMAVAS